MIYPAAKVVLIDPSQTDKLLLIYREVNGAGGYEAAGGRIEVNFFNLKAQKILKYVRLEKLKLKIQIY